MAAVTSTAMAACGAFRSTRGSFPSMRLRRSPDIRPLVKALEADQIGDGLDPNRRVARDHSAGFDVLGDNAAGTDQGAGADPQAGEEGRIGADADVILDCRAQHTLEVTRTHGVRVVGEHDVWPEEHAVAQSRGFEKAAAMDTRSAADAITDLQHGVGADAAIVPDDVVLADEGPMAAVEPVADNRAGIDHGSRANGAARAAYRLQLARLGSSRWFANDSPVLDDRAIADLHVRVDQG